MKIKRKLTGYEIRSIPVEVEVEDTVPDGYVEEQARKKQVAKDRANLAHLNGDAALFRKNTGRDPLPEALAEKKPNRPFGRMSRFRARMLVESIDFMLGRKDYSNAWPVAEELRACGYMDGDTSRAIREGRGIAAESGMVKVRALVGIPPLEA